MLDGGNNVLEIVVEATKTTEAIRGVRNLVIMTKILGSIDPELLKKIADAIPNVLVGEAKAQETDPPGWEVLHILRSKNLGRGLTVANNLLEALGKNFSVESS